LIKLQCQICNRIFKVFRGLSNHVVQKHDISKKDYYDKYFKKNHEGHCNTCNKETKFISMNNGYRSYCSNSCAQSNEEIINLKKKTKLEKYGDENYVNAKQISSSHNKRSNKDIIKSNSLRENTNLELYGIKYLMFDQKNKDKISKTSSKNSKERMNKTNKTKLESVDVDGLNIYQQATKKVKRTKLERYGDENYNNYEKHKQTCLERYGVEHTQQVPEIHEKTQKFRWKDYTLPSGKIIKVQGYEDKALDLLLQEYDESEIETQRSNVPEIWYFDKDGIKHRYFPDIYIKKDNLIIEVKSLYTYENNVNINNLKKKSCIESGYEFKFMILR